MTTVSSTEAFSTRLRAATRDNHRAAESADFVTALMAGELTVDSYARLATQHYFIYQVLEEAAEAMRDDPLAGPFVIDGLARGPALRADLADLRGPQWRDRLLPTDATVAYCARLRQVCFTWPAGFVAHHYTRYLGDLSGGQAIRTVLGRHYGLTDGRGVAFYDFSGLGSPVAFKRRYREQLDALPCSPAELDRLVDEANLAFQLNREVFHSLSP